VLAVYCEPVSALFSLFCRDNTGNIYKISPVLDSFPSENAAVPLAFSPLDETPKINIRELTGNAGAVRKSHIQAGPVTP
jgi:hypothetical protein